MSCLGKPVINGKITGHYGLPHIKVYTDYGDKRGGCITYTKSKARNVRNFVCYSFQVYLC